MRVIVNERKVKRNRQTAQILFFVSFGILAGGLLVSSGLLLPLTPLLASLPLLILPVGLITTLISVRLTNEYIRPPHPDEAIREGLKGINRQSVLFDYVLPAQHVLIAPQGVYALVTRFQETRFKVEGKKWTNFKGRGPIGPLMLYLKQEGLRDPFREADIAAASVQKLVDDTLPGAGITVQSAVVFTNDNANLEIIDPEMPVVYASNRKKPSLKTLLKEDRKEQQQEMQQIQPLQPPNRNKKARGKGGSKPVRVVPIEDETPETIVLTADQIDKLRKKILANIGRDEVQRSLVEIDA